MDRTADMQFVRRPFFAGTFYAGNREQLQNDVADMIQENTGESITGRIRALVSPHAGYMYSGAVAAAAYGQLTDRGYRTVIIVAPSHRHFPGVALFPGDAYETPLGVIPVDTEILDRLVDADNAIVRSTHGHGEEHSLEVQLPFLQVTLGNFHLAPVVIGDQYPELCARLGERIALLLQREDVLLVASSDLSHMHRYDEAVALDHKVVDRLAQYDTDGFTRDWLTHASEACGGGPIIAAMTAARLAGADRSKVLMYRNSGDVTGDRRAVVGYLSAVFYQSGGSDA